MTTLEQKFYNIINSFWANISLCYNKEVLSKKERREKDEKQKAKLKELKNSMTDEEIKKLKEKEIKLNEFHDYVDSEEDLKKILLLDNSDFNKNASKTIIEK